MALRPDRRQARVLVVSVAAGPSTSTSPHDAIAAHLVDVRAAPVARRLRALGAGVVRWDPAKGSLVAALARVGRAA